MLGIAEFDFRHCKIIVAIGKFDFSLVLIMLTNVEFDLGHDYTILAIANLSHGWIM